VKEWIAADEATGGTFGPQDRGRPTGDAGTSMAQRGREGR
jgi:hypothetical protein